MKKLLFIILFSSFAIASAAQTDSIEGKTYNVVQIEAKFQGGQAGWRKYLENNLDVSLGAKYLKPKKGETLEQTVWVSFLVDKEGNINEVHVENENEVHRRLRRKPFELFRRDPNGYLPLKTAEK